MLNQREKKEMLQDAGSLRRRDSFRRARAAAAPPSAASLDSYLKFLSSVHKVFSHVTAAGLKPSRTVFKL